MTESALDSSKHSRWWFHATLICTGLAVMLLLAPHLSTQTQPAQRFLSMGSSEASGAISASRNSHLTTQETAAPQQLQHVAASSRSNPGQQTEGAYDLAASQNWVQELAALGNCGRSKQGKRYRSLLCVLVRNDIHMREFVVRNLLLGFCHIVVSDNNQVAAGRDHNMTLLLQPFVQQGLVTHIPYNANGSQGFLDMDTKTGSARKCMQEYGSQADWAMDLDSDEYLLISKHSNSSNSNSSSSSVAAGDRAIQGNVTSKAVDSTATPARQVGVLPEFLEDVEQRMPETCALQAPWRMMYGEHKVLNTPGQLLMDAFQRICFSVSHKVILRTDRATYKPPHWAFCKDTKAHKPYSVDSNDRLKALPEYDVHLIHYYAKSVEEYIAKSEQSQPPYFRKMVDMFDTTGGTSCSNQAVHYTQEYKEAVGRIMRGLRAAQGGLPDGGHMLGPLPEYKPHSRADYNLYLFLKLRVAHMSEWDDAAYLSRHPNVSTAVTSKKYIDGLHHFLADGFNKGLASCWNDTRVPSGRAFCIQ